MRCISDQDPQRDAGSKNPVRSRADSHARGQIRPREGHTLVRRTKYGAYVCRKEADAADGDRDTRNGQ